MDVSGILIFFHCRSNTGYAIGRLEPVFLEMALRLSGDIERIHFAYPSLEGDAPLFLGKGFTNIIEFDSQDSSREGLLKIHDYIVRNNIDVAFGFDQPVSRPAFSIMKKAGVKLLVSYWGAPMSSINHGIKLFLKRGLVRLVRHQPDHFIFESLSMADTAIYGRGIPAKRVSVVPLGVDTELFQPNPDTYAHRVLGIPAARKIIYYSGHMEERKGVQVIIEAANELIRKRNRKDVHFLFLGNADGEEEKFGPRYLGTETEQYITFAGYRSDVNRIAPSCYAGVIASTGWDSFTMSSLEMASSGLPLIVSNLQGLTETIDVGHTGYLIEPGDHVGLADRIEALLDDRELQLRFGVAARKRIVQQFSRERQIESLAATVRALYSQC